MYVSIIYLCTTFVSCNICLYYSENLVFYLLNQQARNLVFCIKWKAVYLKLLQAFNGKKWEKFNSEKVASLAYARIQGKVALVTHFQNSNLMNEDKRCRPILFQSEGQSFGDKVTKLS